MRFLIRVENTKPTAPAANPLSSWIAEHKIAVLTSGDKIGFALSFDDYLSDNNRRHLTVVGSDLGDVISRFCAMHNLPPPPQ